MPSTPRYMPDGAVLRLLGLLLRPRLQLREHRRLVLLEQALLGRLQVRVAGAAEPDVELRIGLLGGDLRERFARALERHRDLDAGLLLELGGGERAPFGLHRADDVELLAQRPAANAQRDGSGDAAMRHSDAVVMRCLLRIGRVVTSRNARRELQYSMHRRGRGVNQCTVPALRTCSLTATAPRHRPRRHQDRDRRARRRRPRAAAGTASPTPHGDYDGDARRDRRRSSRDAERELGVRRARRRSASARPDRSRARPGCCAARTRCASTAGRSSATSSACSAATCAITNDANCFALSEATDGAGAGARVRVRRDPRHRRGRGHRRATDGCSTGPNAIAGEWGHNPLPWPRDDERPGPACYCGRRGCIETFLSGPALERDHRARDRRAT